MLVSMGFDEERARKALAEHRGSVNEATKALVAEEEAQAEATTQAEARVAPPAASAPQAEAAPAQAPPTTAGSTAATLIDELNSSGPDPSWQLTPQPDSSQDWFATPPPAFGTGGAVISTGPEPISSTPVGVQGVGVQGSTIGEGSKRGGGGSPNVMLLPPPPGFTPPSITAPHNMDPPAHSSEPHSAEVPTNAFANLDLDILL